MSTTDAKTIGGLIILIIVLLAIIFIYLRKTSNKVNAETERISKLSMVSEVGHDSEEIDKCFRLSTIIEEDYNNLSTTRISVVIIIETDGNLSATL